MAGSVSSARIGSAIGNDSLAALLPFFACNLACGDENCESLRNRCCVKVAARCGNDGITTVFPRVVVMLARSTCRHTHDIP